VAVAVEAAGLGIDSIFEAGIKGKFDVFACGVKLSSCNVTVIVNVARDAAAVAWALEV
jgi:hypothetical protein